MPGILAGLAEGGQAIQTNMLQQAASDRADKMLALQTPIMQAQGSLDQTQANEAQALSPGAMENAKAAQAREKQLNTAIPIEQLTKAHPFVGPLLKSVGPMVGIAPDAVGASPLQLKAAYEYADAHPELPLETMNQLHKGISEKVTNYNQTLEDLQKKLSKFSLIQASSL